MPWCLAKMRLESDKHMKILVSDLEYELFDFLLLCVALPKLAHRLYKLALGISGVPVQIHN